MAKKFFNAVPFFNQFTPDQLYVNQAERRRNTQIHLDCWKVLLLQVRLRQPKNIFRQCAVSSSSTTRISTERERESPIESLEINDTLTLPADAALMSPLYCHS